MPDMQGTPTQVPQRAASPLASPHSPERVSSVNQQQQGEKDYNESFPDEATAGHEPKGPQVKIDSKSRLGSGPVIAAAAVAVALGVGIALGIHHQAEAETSLKHTTEKAAVPSVVTTHPEGGAKAQELRLPADTQAYTDTAIYSRTSGYLQKWYADIGTTVKKGQLLAVVQTPEVDQQVQQAQADVATAQANEQLAQTTNNRWKALLAKNAVSRQEADQASGDLSARESALSSAQANVRRLQQMQGFERIYAPFDGVITARNVDVGSLIQAGDNSNPHSELFHLSSVGTLRLFVPVPEVNVSAVRDGEQVKVTSDAFPNESFTGTVVRNATSIDLASRTLRVEVDLPNSGHHLLPGQYAFVHLPIPAAASSMTLPSNALLFRAEGLRVGVVQDDRVHLVPVSIGHDYGATVEITAGLQPQDQVILNPSDSLADGAHVHVEAK